MPLHRGLGRVAAALFTAVLLASCGGDDGPTESDAATVQALLSSSAAVQQAFAELYGCLPDRPECYERHGPSAVTVVNAQRQRFAGALEDTDNDCLREVGELYLSSLDSYADAAQAAADANPSRFDTAISKTTESEIAFNRKLADCGYTEGRTAEIGAAMREVSVKLLQLGEEVGDCLRPRCMHDIARRMEEAAGDGVGLLDDYGDELEEAPACLREAVTTFRSSLQALQTAARALQEDDFATAEREGTRAGELEVEAQADMAACIGSLAG
jgi:hypothetical protein